MNPKTIVTNLLLLLLLQISNFSIVVFSLERFYGRPHKPEFKVLPNAVSRIVVANELWGLKKGNAGFVCAHGPKVWRKSRPGNQYVVVEFKHDGIERYKFVHCHLRSSLGYVNVPINIHPDTAAMCYPTYKCHYYIRKDGVYYKPENKLFRWLPFPRSKNGRRRSTALK